MLELSDLAELAFRDQNRFQDVTEEENASGKNYFLFIIINIFLSAKFKQKNRCRF
jgi:hypothetical protein